MNIEDKVKGIIYGQAIGDALGLSTEFMSKSEVQKAYPDGINSYEDIQVDAHTERWVKGDWTDDTDQMLCILDAILEEGSLSVDGVSKKFMEWYLGEPMGIGNTVFSVLSDRNFLHAPHTVSQKVWELSGRQSAANGGVMRTSILGIWDHTNPDKVEHNAKEICQITHYDPRCVASCVAVSIAISMLLLGTNNDDNIIKECIKRAREYDNKIENSLSNLPNKIEALKLDEPSSIGYTYKALAAGFWVFKHSKSFEEGIKCIIYEGGDADTNASVGGAILGAKFGYRGIPEQLKEGLVYRTELDTRIDQLLRMLDSNTQSGYLE